MLKAPRGHPRGRVCSSFTWYTRAGTPSPSPLSVTFFRKNSTVLKYYSAEIKSWFATFICFICLNRLFIGFSVAQSDVSYIYVQLWLWLKESEIHSSLSHFLVSPSPLPHPPLLPACPSILPHPSILAPPPGDANPEEDEEACSISKRQKPLLHPKKRSAILDIFYI